MKKKFNSLVYRDGIKLVKGIYSNNTYSNVSNVHKDILSKVFHLNDLLLNPCTFPNVVIGT